MINKLADPPPPAGEAGIRREGYHGARSGSSYLQFNWN